MSLHRLLLPAIAFTSGFALMTFELIAARILAPSIGSSTYIWTSVIGVIIAALSVGYWAGGKVADARNRQSDIAWLLLLTAVTVGLTLLLYIPFIATVTQTFTDPRIQGVIASLLLFAPMSFLIGMLSPYLVKLQITSLQQSGKLFASLSALESIGGIVGTFVTGFILFGFIGVRESLFIVVAVLVIVSWLITPRHRTGVRAGITAVLLVSCVALLQLSQPGQIETTSAHYSIHDDISNGRPVRGISTGPGGIQSGIYLDNPDELLFWYTKQLARVTDAAPARDRILVLGGGTFTLPSYLAKTYPDSQIDVVEIDPQLVDIAREHFYHKDPANVTLIFDDARRYVNNTTRSYDVVLVDVYSDTDVPFSLITQQYAQQLRRIVSLDGVVGVNAIAGTVGPCADLLRSIDAPYRKYWSSAQYQQAVPGAVSSNMILVYSRTALDLPGFTTLDGGGTAPFSDNFAPAERRQQACRQASE